VFNLVNVEGATCKWPWLVVIQVVICPAGSQCGRSRTQTLTIHETSPTVFRVDSCDARGSSSCQNFAQKSI